MKKIDFDAIKQHVLKRLENELPAHLYYHGIHHTRDDVLPAAERFAKLSQISDEDFLLVQVAAIYHDVGYVESPTEHEATGAKIVGQELPGFGFTPEQIKKIQGMILATKIPQSASTLLEKIICDADMDSLGRIDFLITSHCLRVELHHAGVNLSLRDWYIRQLKFLESHVYFTEAAQKLRNEGKKKNIDELKSILTVQPEVVSS